jgi:hypothetical protein
MRQIEPLRQICLKWHIAPFLLTAHWQSYRALQGRFEGVYHILPIFTLIFNNSLLALYLYILQEEEIIK